MTRLLNRLLCLLSHHHWADFPDAIMGDECLVTSRCSRCGKYRNRLYVHSDFSAISKGATNE
jgi:hypothetical protein